MKYVCLREKSENQKKTNPKTNQKRGHGRPLFIPLSVKLNVLTAVPGKALLQLIYEHVIDDSAQWTQGG